MRGLKLCSVSGTAKKSVVAPYVGAWIETANSKAIIDQADVAPYVGAWIETAFYVKILCLVASHPTWVRGLKQDIDADSDAFVKSHPTWVRGLKLPTPLYVLLNLRRTLRGCVD